MQNEKNTRNSHYKVRPFRISDEILKQLRNSKPSNLSWNLYFKKLLAESINQITNK